MENMQLTKTNEVTIRVVERIRFVFDEGEAKIYRTHHTIVNPQED